MAVSRRLRYEILRRDNHQCRYCGATAPDVKLTVDHVVPVALGGGDEPTNLVTACQDCNAGKASTDPAAEVVADVEQDAVRWRNAMQAAAQQMAADHAEADEFCRAFYNAWPRSFPDNWESSLRALHQAGLPKSVMLGAVDIAMSARGVDSRFRYFCGVCWKRVAQLQEAAAGILASGESADAPGDEPPRGDSSNLLTMTVAEAWSKAIDPQTAAHCEFISNDYGEVTVRADSTAWATQLRLMERRLRDRINAQFGGESAVSKVNVLGPRSKFTRKGGS